MLAAFALVTSPVVLAQGTTPTVRIAKVTPVATYPQSGYEFWVDGDGFSATAAENLLIIDGHQTEATIEKASTRQLLVKSVQLADPKRGKRSIQIRVAQTDSNAMDLVFSARDRQTPRALALVMVVGFGVLFLALIFIGIRNLPDPRPKFLAALFQENGAYSLSKLQFYLWTAVAVGGYLYVAFARSLVQGVITLPEVPDGLPGLIGISVGTSVAASAITELRGAKGFAGTEPSLGDLIMTGGSVVAERVQFLAWTLVSIVAFVVLVGTYDPATLETLPPIPYSLLWLMGLSASGYLGGKFVRGPAPAITEAVADVSTPLQPVLTVRGRNLSKQAGLILNGRPIPLGTNVVPNHDPIEGSDPESPGGADFFKLLKITLNLDASLPVGQLPVRIINPDGQTANGIIPVTAAGRVGVWRRM